MAGQAIPPARRGRPTDLERQLLDEVLELKDQVQHLAVAIERQTNAVNQMQVLSSRDIGSLTDKQTDTAERVGKLEAWRTTIEQERAERRGAERMRKSFVAMVATLAGLGGGAVTALVNWLLRGGS